MHDLKIDNYDQIASILTALREADITVLEMQLLQPDLEDVFVEIMHENEKERI